MAPSLNLILSLFALLLARQLQQLEVQTPYGRRKVASFLCPTLSVILTKDYPQQTSPHIPESTLGHIPTPKLIPEKGNETTMTHFKPSGYLTNQKSEL